jgi:cobalt-zinc-cadmium resistance protein CzcA
MLDKIIHFSIHNKLIIGILAVCWVVWGVYSFAQLPIDAVPDVTNNQVQVITRSPSLAASEVERLITFPVEITMATIPRLTEIRSFSRFGLSVVTIVFTDDTDVYWARQQVFERLTQAQAQIPAGVGNPELAPVTTGLGEIFQYVIRVKPGFAHKFTPMDLRTVQDWIVRRQLLGTQGVADVSSFGGYLKQYEIAVDPAKLRAADVSIDEIFTALEQNNQNTGGAYIDKQPQAYFIRSEGLIGSLDDLGQVVVRNTPGGSPLLIRDVAKVQWGHAVRYGAMTYNDQGEAVGGIVMMLKGDNSSEVIANVKERIRQIQTSLPDGLEIEGFLDRTKLVNNAIGTVGLNLAEGALIVIFVLVLLLGNLRAGLVVASVIPLAMLFAIGMMNLFGVSGNLMSLGAIDFGLIVDGAVIIVEATMHHLGLAALGRRLSQAEMDEEVYQSATKIRNSAAFGEIIIMIVYLPILALAGVEGKMFKPMAQTVAFSILGAFILSLTYVPMASALFLSKNISDKKTWADRLVAWVQRGYTPALRLALRYRRAVVAVAVLLLAGSLWLFSRMGGEFIPTLDEGDFAVDTRVMTGASLSETVRASLQAGGMLRDSFPEVIKVVGKIGASEIPTDPMAIEACDLMVILKPREQWTSAATRDELAEKMQQVLQANTLGTSYGFQQPIQMRFNELITGIRQDVAIKIYGEDLDQLVAYADQVAKLVGNVPGVRDLYVEKLSGLPQIVVTYDRAKLAEFGLSVAEANRAINTAFAGGLAGQVFEGERRYDLVVRLDQPSRQGIDDVAQLFVHARDGRQVPLNQLARVEMKTSYNEIRRDDAKRRISVAFNVRGRDVESVVREMDGLLRAKLRFAPGYYATYGGQFQNLQEAKGRLSVAVPAALALIFVLLYFTFHSVKQSVLIFSAIPLSAIGGVLALWLRDMPFSISAGVGFIALFGVSVLNGIVLIGEFNHLKKEGMKNLYRIVFRGTEIRLRPVLMTAAVASLGFLPMALSHGSGAEVQKPLATVVIGGLLSSTLLTLVVLPCLYVWFERGLGRAKRARLAVLAGGLVLAGLGTPAHAQVLTLEQALAEAKQNNLAVKAGLYEIDLQKLLRRTATDVGKTNLTWLAGQYNSLQFDNNFTVAQSLPFPTTFGRLAELYAAQAKTGEARLRLTQAELAAQVKAAYYHLAHAHALRARLARQDSLLAAFVRAADLRLRTGEGTLLEQSTAQAQWAELQNAQLQNQADTEIFLAQLQALLNRPAAPPVGNLPLTKRPAPPLDTAALGLNPGLALLQQQTEVARRLVGVEQARLWPDLSLGYFNQSLIGTYRIGGQDQFLDGRRRFSGFQVGVALPLWARPQKARLGAARLGAQVAQAQADLHRKNLHAQLAAAAQQLAKQQAALQLFERQWLPNADLLQANAQKAFAAGEIGYWEYAQALTRAHAARVAHLAALNGYNQAVVQIEFLLGNE